MKKLIVKIGLYSAPESVLAETEIEVEDDATEQDILKLALLNILDNFFYEVEEK